MPQRGVLFVVYLLPWAYIAYNLIQNCRDTSEAGFISFEAIVNQGTSDKRTHHYGAFYSLYLDPLRLPLQPETPADCQQPQAGEVDRSQYTQDAQNSQQQPWEPRAVNMLEIGLKYGDSLKLWKRAFPRGRIYGIDNEMISKKHQAEARDPRVRLMVGDQANGTFLEQVVAEIKSAVGLLDFIVDDGGHTMDQQQTSLKHLLPLVKVPAIAGQGTCHCRSRYLPLPVKVPAIAGQGTFHCRSRYLPLPVKVPAIAGQDTCHCQSRYLPLPVKVPSIAGQGTFHCRSRYLPLPLKVPSIAAQGTFHCRSRYFPLPVKVPAIAGQGTFHCRSRYLPLPVKVPSIAGQGTFHCRSRYLPLPLKVPSIAAQGTFHCRSRYLPLPVKVPSIAGQGTCHCRSRYLPLPLKVPSIAAQGTFHCRSRYLPLPLKVPAIAGQGTCHCRSRYLPLPLKVPPVASQGTSSWLQLHSASVSQYNCRSLNHPLQLSFLLQTSPPSCFSIPLSLSLLPRFPLQSHLILLPVCPYSAAPIQYAFSQPSPFSLSSTVHLSSSIRLPSLALHSPSRYPFVVDF
ncbi:unnamed protein product [Closterium sp. NIES-53]